MKAFTISSSTGKLTLSNVTIKDSNKNLLDLHRRHGVYHQVDCRRGTRGIDTSASCAEITIQQTKVLNATGIGISIAGSATYTIINSGVFYNARTTGEAGVSLVTTGSGKFAFNTIQNNGKGGGTVGGLDCGTSSKAIANSLISDNTLKASTQIAGSCTFTKVVVGSVDATGITGAIKQDPMYSGGRAAQATDTACIDKADPDPTVTTDFFGAFVRLVQPRHRLSRSEVVALSFPPTLRTAGCLQLTGTVCCPAASWPADAVPFARDCLPSSKKDILRLSFVCFVFSGTRRGIMDRSFPALVSCCRRCLSVWEWLLATDHRSARSCKTLVNDDLGCRTRSRLWRQQLSARRGLA